MKKIIISALLLGLHINHANAGLDWTTVHSRANCLNNESITWWYLHPYNWKVVSIHKHIPTNQIHKIDTGWKIKDRVAAVCWGEGVHGGFEVFGYHYLYEYNKNIPFDTTYAKTCNIIDGW